jgi:cobalt/nickel transport system ATP-binding protein
MNSAILIQHLSYSYPDGRQALSNINLKINPGEKIALIGPNGAGKSTLLLHLNGILKGTGDIHILDLELSARNLPAIRSHVGLVFQNPDDQLFSPTVFDDLAFGPIYQGLDPQEVGNRVDQALTDVQLPGFRERVSHHLSLGEKKRIALASVLSMHPDILVLDEPTSGLDPRSRRDLINLLKSFEMTVLIATHDMLMVRDLVPRLVVLDAGRIVFDGNTERAFQDQSFLSAHGLELPA